MAREALESWLTSEGRIEKERELIEWQIKDYHGNREWSNGIGKGEEVWQGFIHWNWGEPKTLFFPDVRGVDMLVGVSKQFGQGRG